MESRILKEYKDSRSLQSQYILALDPISTDDLTHWECTIKGPLHSPFANHTFKLRIDIPQTYPLTTPICKFEPFAMPHPNVNFETGEICLDILDTNWSPVFNIQYIVEAIVWLLNEPNFKSPLNLDLANLLRFDDLKAYHDLISYHLNNSAK
ncbi:hypothetical protein KAFR_0C01990 [Kazachstania africana CBS 2517]|uniref:UBC core domain-containing protein n=1 Tax=Kazachstania africana (strain ATCC 22294 / BCRC 22015 / CBS 2517 / CECT 1963 / NBRC 1671 / NRRL Y-8276) TaxID=1071382 RepID=H2AS42_KAZAF|nr:hypothetical protein KAFR_0C01990 [Kazachstania africana CBS 2517]CCF57192.1 hypothetical protein KAFR_0C01990 [Kazachstania africana CBS 2517]